MSSPNVLCTELGKRIRMLRRKKGWSQIEMAAYLGINRGHPSDLERGRREIGLLIATNHRSRIGYDHGGDAERALTRVETVRYG